LKVKTDNTTACYNLTKGKAKVGLRRLVDQILLYIEEQQWEVKFRHIPGINNTEADSLSRLAVSGDYSVDKQVLQQVLDEWEIQITMDCFATRRNAKHNRYFSIESDSLAENWDGMEQSQECETPLLHCPISLIPAVIHKVELEQEKSELIAPIWKGQVWWTALMRITIRWKELRDSQNVLEEGSWIKLNKRKLSLGKIESDACIIQEGNYISTLFELMGKPMNLIRNNVTEQLMNEHVERASKVREEIVYWKLSELKQNLSNQAILRDENKINSEQLMKISFTLIKVYTVLRMAEVQRAELRIENINQGQIVIATMTMKKPGGPVEKTLKAAQDRIVCPIRWIQSWLDNREVKGELKK
ncbi:MAG: hypothetical protein EZS28_046390, partial [Streblomastix strix]